MKKVVRNSIGVVAFLVLMPVVSAQDDLFDVPKPQPITAIHGRTVVIRHHPSLITLSADLLKVNLNSRYEAILEQVGADKPPQGYRFSVSSWGQQPPGVNVLQIEVSAVADREVVKKVFDVTIGELRKLLMRRLVDEPRQAYEQQLALLGRRLADTDDELGILQQELAKHTLEPADRFDDFVKRRAQLEVDERVSEIKSKFLNREIQRTEMKLKELTQRGNDIGEKLPAIQAAIKNALKGVDRVVEEDVAKLRGEQLQIDLILADLNAERDALSKQLKNMKSDLHQTILDRVTMDGERDTLAKLIAEHAEQRRDAMREIQKTRSRIVPVQAMRDQLQSQIVETHGRIQAASQFDIRVWEP